MTRAKRDPASILDAIIERAPKLHAAGIRELSFDGLSVTLGTPFYVSMSDQTPKLKFNAGGPGDDDEKPPEADTRDPLADPATYPGGRVPGFTRPKKEQA